MSDGQQISVMLDEEHSRRLKQMARDANADEAVLARSLLARAIDGADVDGPAVAELLDSIPGAWERIDAARAELAAGKGIPLEDF